jgi:gamma-glutamyltranspeptidase / glutathione hydrolase
MNGSVVYAERGMVATAHPLASAAGLRILQAGGNAVDAAIAAAAATWVTMPMMCGPGGDAFLLIYQAKTGKVTAINGSGIVGRRATREYLAGKGFADQMPAAGMLSAAVPGAVDAFQEGLTRFGTRHWEELLRDAVTYANGHPLSEQVAGHFTNAQAKLAQFPSTARIYLKEGRVPRAGEILRQPEYAESLRQIARGGADAFYRGELGARIGAAADAEGLFDAGELASHRSEVHEPLRIDYRGYQMLTMAPPSQAMLHLESQAITAQFDLAGMAPADREHVLVEANKIATADRLRWAGDPRFVHVPVADLISPEYAQRRATEIRLDSCLPLDVAGDPEGDTTYLCVVDSDGNAVSLIQSLSHSFGTGQVIEGTGLFLNNRAGRGFTLQEGHPNCIAPGKRTMHTLGCYMVLKGGRPCLVGGTPGGDGQPQWNLQVLTKVLDLGMNVQQACEAPRWTRRPATDPAGWSAPPTLQMESRFDPAVMEALRSKGHPVEVVGPWASTGAVQLIGIDQERGVLHGGSDPRAGGAVLGF